MKPLSRKAYGSIGHLPGSKLGPGDRQVNPGHGRMCTERPAQKGDRVIVQEKADGTCVAIGNVDGRLVPLQRKGYTCLSSPHLQHHLFAGWCAANRGRLEALGLDPGERVVGEWLAQAHGTRYGGLHDILVIFDIFDASNERRPVAEVAERCAQVGLAYAPILHIGAPVPVEDVYPTSSMLASASIDPPEGVVYRVERGHRTLLLAKWVRPDYEAGRYLPGLGRPADAEPLWNIGMWRTAA